MKLLPLVALCLVLVSGPHEVAAGPLRAQPLILSTTNLNTSRGVSHFNATAGFSAREDPAWTSIGPDSTDYNEETTVKGLPFTVETLGAIFFILMLASSPFLLAALAEEQLTRAHLLESVALITWLGGITYLFTNVLKFQSAHWTGTRPLTLVEAVYLLSQILTTVGYGDITPAFPRGQVWVGINVIVALCLYGSMISEVVGIVSARIAKIQAKAEEERHEEHGPLKEWVPKVDKSAFVESVVFFFSLATVGVMFWHFYPGEEKTWLQAVYMSIITLSTVGFGAFTAATEGGKVFGAFWMLFGVSALGALVTSFIEYMLAVKSAGLAQQVDHHHHFQTTLDACTSKSRDLDKLQFLKLSLMLTKNLDEDDFKAIDTRFRFLCSKEDVMATSVRRTTIVDTEGPPL